MPHIPFVSRFPVFAFAVAVTLSATPVVLAQSSLAIQSTSLAFIPDDVAFYSCSLRTKEQLDAVLRSRAFAKIKQHPLVQMGIAQVMAQWESPQLPQVAIAKQLLEQPDNQELVALLQDAVSHEIFVAGDKNASKLLQLLLELSQKMNSIQLTIALDGRPANDVIREHILEFLSKTTDELAMPGGMIGFKLSDAAPARKQLARLESLVNAKLQQAPPEIAKRFGKSKIGEGEFLTVSLDGSLVPWQDIPLDDLDGEDRARVETLIEKGKTLTATISLGVINDYLIFSVAESTDNLKNLGAGNLLANRMEMAPLKRFADKPLTSIAYVSETFMQAVLNQSRSMESSLNMLRSTLEHADEEDLPVELKAELAADIDELGKDFQQYMVTPGAVAGVSWMKPTGYESYVYNYTKNPRQKKDKPLTVLAHTGTHPLFVAAGHNGAKIEDYDLLVKWAKRADYYVNKIAIPKMDEDDLAEFKEARRRFMPLIERLDANIRENVFPAFNDGEFAFVMDAKAKSNTWHAALPPAEQELPMLEFAMVCGINDINRVERSFASLFGILDDAITQWNEMVPEEGNRIPLQTFPRPDQDDIETGTLYSYTIPPESGLDRRIAPNWGLSPQTFIMSLMPETTKRLMPQSRSAAFFGPLSESSRPLSGAVYLDFAGLIDTIHPWINYGAMLWMGGTDPDELEQQVQMIKSSVDFGVDILTCFKGISGAIYQEGNATVTHTETLFEDLP
jgi:hypothetical protein